MKDTIFKRMQNILCDRNQYGVNNGKNYNVRKIESGVFNFRSTVLPIIYKPLSDIF